MILGCFSKASSIANNSVCCLSVIFISSEIEEMIRTCQRMVVMRDKKKVGELESDEISQNNIMSAIAGGE